MIGATDNFDFLGTSSVGRGGAGAVWKDYMPVHRVRGEPSAVFFFFYELPISANARTSQHNLGGSSKHHL